MEQSDVLIVGAGAAGLGIGIALKQLGARFVILEQHTIGHSFARWPAETRFITPSFTSNAFNLPDLNAITPDTSPAYSLGKEHPTGKEYALYLRALARHYELPIREKVRALRVEQPGEEDFLVHTNRGPFRSRFLVWAVGEFQFPRYALPGSERGLHYGTIRRWSQVKGKRQVVLGGYESGIDAAYHLALLGKEVVVFDPRAPWKLQEGEPSLDLSPFTHERLEAALKTGRLTLVQARVDRVEHKKGRYLIHHQDGTIETPHPPIVATGFAGGLGLLEGLFETHEEAPLLSEKDESTLARGLFMVGPKVRHLQTPFCFIYKFRARFPVVAEEIGRRLGLDTAPLEVYRKRGMWADDLEACCTSRCAC